jgi:LPS-assembly protein
MKRHKKPGLKLLPALRVSGRPARGKRRRLGAALRMVAVPVLGVTGAGAAIGIAHAQLGSLLSAPGTAPPPSTKMPVTFLADQVDYDKTGNIVTAQGHVRAWQNGETLYADKVVINRTTNVATATGNVILLQPGGDTVFARTAVLSHGMKDAVMEGVAARLAQNGRMIANGARRYDGKIDELSKVVYSACNLCKSDPTRAPLWQIHATSATRDLQHKMIEYRNAVMEIGGIPVFYIPYMTQPDPSVRRQTGLLIPSIGQSSRVGLFVSIPYYIVLDQESDITLTPVIASKAGPILDAQYRRAFNSGVLHVNLSGGNDRGLVGSNQRGQFGDAIFANGSFDINDTWRAGFSYNRASSARYLDDFNILPNAAELTSNVYVEGFGPGAYARLEADTYQGLVSSITQSSLPIIAPYAQYDFNSNPDRLGGRFDVDAEFFNVLRNVGTNSRRASVVGTYSVPFSGPLGQLWLARVQLVAASYNATALNKQPTYSAQNGADTGRVQPYGALFMRWPFARSAGAYGSQIVEPEVQFVASPEVGIGQNPKIPNEDSLDLEYSDANLFALNRYPGIDRLEGGERVDYAMHGAWYLPGGALLDGIVGQSYRFHKDLDYLPLSGLNDNISDIVARATVAPVPYFNLTYRTRLSHKDLGARMIDASATAGTSLLNITAGYLYTNTNPYVLYNQPGIPAAYYIARHEVSASAASAFGPWTLSAGTVRNLATGTFDSADFSAGWQNECLAVSLNFYKRFTSFNLDNGSTTVLFQITFKTLGNVGFSAL